MSAKNLDRHNRYRNITVGFKVSPEEADDFNSFLMAQLAYHISTGTPLWNYTVRKGTVLYLALEDDYRRLQEKLYQMFGTDGAENLFFTVSAGQLGNGLDEQLTRFMQEHSDTKIAQPILNAFKELVQGVVIKYFEIKNTLEQWRQG